MTNNHSDQVFCHIDILMIIQDDIATNNIIERLLLACEPHGLSFRKVYLSSLLLTDFQPNTIPLIIRCADPKVGVLTTILKKTGRPYIYYLDDNLWEIPGDSPLAQYYRNPTVRRTLKRVIANASAVLVNSEELAFFLKSYTSRIHLVPALFDFSLIDSPDGTASENEYRIGFASSPSRASDLEIIRPVIDRVLKQHPKAVFEFIGVMPKEIAVDERVRFFPYLPEYAAFLRFLVGRKWSVGLAPLIDNEANRCKTNNKYRDYGACNIAGIYSAIPPYSTSVEDGTTGVLVANTPDAWTSEIIHLLDNPVIRQSIVCNAHADVQEKYDVKQVAHAWLKCFKLVADELPKSPQKSLKIAALLLLPNISVCLIDSLRIRVEYSFREGGIRLVLLRSVRRLRKILMRS